MKTTKRQLLSLTRKAQKLQIKDCGKHSVEINLRLDDKGKELYVWIIIKSEEDYLHFNFYPFWSPERNEAQLQTMAAILNISI